MSRKFKLEIDFDITKQSQQQLATLLHSIARDFDIGIAYNVQDAVNQGQDTNVEVRDNNNKIVGTWNYK